MKKQDKDSILLFVGLLANAACLYLAYGLITNWLESL